MFYILLPYFNPALSLLKPRFQPYFKRILKQKVGRHLEKMDNICSRKENNLSKYKTKKELYQMNDTALFLFYN